MGKLQFMMNMLAVGINVKPTFRLLTVNDISTSLGNMTFTDTVNKEIYSNYNYPDGDVFLSSIESE